MKFKTGICIDCPEGSDPRYIQAKRCVVGPHFHYQKHKQKQYEAKAKANPKRNVRKEKLNSFFQEQANNIPAHCENCKQKLVLSHLGLRAFMAHIVPKNTFESVMTHPDNLVFLCLDCHTKFDNHSTSDDIRRMPAFPLMCRRFEQFAHLITPEESQSLRDCFYQIWDEIYDPLNERRSE